MGSNSVSRTPRGLPEHTFERRPHPHVHEKATEIGAAGPPARNPLSLVSRNRPRAQSGLGNPPPPALDGPPRSDRRARWTPPAGPTTQRRQRTPSQDADPRKENGRCLATRAAFSPGPSWSNSKTASPSPSRTGTAVASTLTSGAKGSTGSATWPPGRGDDLVFAAEADRFTAVNDFDPGTTCGSITLEASYDLSGNGITLPASDSVDVPPP